MRLKRLHVKQDGFVVVVVLCMVILLSVLLFGFNHKCRKALEAADRFQKSLQTLNCARSGLNIAIAAIADTENPGAARQLQSRLSAEHSLSIGRGQCSIVVVEESSKLNINLLKNNNGTPDRTRIDQLLRLIDLLNLSQNADCRISYGLAASIIDWTDGDNEITHLPFVKHDNVGVESGYYARLKTPYSCRNAPLGTIGELLLVKGVTPRILGRLADYVTVYGDGKININSASKLVIQSLSERVDAALAQMIINQRQLKPFESIAELRGVPAMTEEIYEAISRTATVRPDDRYYQVTASANVGDVSTTIVAILRKNNKVKTVEVVLYREC